jgi:hypothetical protein
MSVRIGDIIEINKMLAGRAGVLSAVRKRNEKKKRDEARAHAEYMSRNSKLRYFI